MDLQCIDQVLDIVSLSQVYSAPNSNHIIQSGNASIATPRPCVRDEMELAIELEVAMHDRPVPRPAITAHGGDLII